MRTPTARRPRRRWMVAAALALLCAAAPAAAREEPPPAAAGPRSGGGTTGTPDRADAPAGDPVRTEAGWVRGTRTAGHRLYQGIPYAAPPTGEHRWAPPRPVTPWPGVRDATRPGPLCPQVPSPYAPIASTEEDCLVLNVTAPADGRSTGPAPVLVWIHGDGAVGGGAFFDGRRLADRGVLVVTVNYRLGVFGGLAHPGLEGSGTFGLQDQQAALRWVRANAAAFGGDPGRVTVAGSSFGAAAVTAHLTSPAARGLFDRAVLASGEGMMDMPAGAMGPEVPGYRWYVWRTARELEDVSAEITAPLGCGGPDAERLRCLRALPVARILEVPSVMNVFQAFPHGTPTLPELPPKALREGRFHRVPVLSGATLDEHRTFVGMRYDAVGTPFTRDDYTTALRTAFGADAPRVRAAYPLRDFPSPALAWSTVVTDRMWALGTHAQHTALARRTPVYAYEFADRDAPMYLPFPGDFDFGAFHAGDTPYLFEDEAARPLFTPAQLRLSDTMTDQWAAFARTGAPTGPGLPDWPRYAPGPGVPYTQSLAPDRTGPVDYAREHRLGFWRGLPSTPRP
ncbi:carboxylesterase/lipase family protein [Streptomyces sp. JNUCC 64]